MTIRIAPIVVVQFYPFDLDACLASVGPLADSAVLASTMPGFDPDPTGKWGHPRVVLRDGEGIEDLLIRAFDLACADAVLLLAATDRLDGDTAGLAQALGSADGLKLTVRLLTNFIASGATRLDPEAEASLGAPWGTDVPEVRLARLKELAGTTADGRALRLRPGADIAVSGLPRILAASELYDDKDATPPAAVMRTVRKHLGANPSNLSALRAAASLGLSTVSAAAAKRVAAAGGEPLLPSHALIGPMRLLQSRIRIALERGEPPALIEALREVVRHTAEGRDSEASAAAAVAVQLDAGADLKLVHAHAAYLDEDLDAADAATKAVIVEDPAAVDAHLIRGFINLDRKLAFRAVGAFNRVLDIQSWHALARTGLEEARERLGLQNEAPSEQYADGAPFHLGSGGVLHFIPHLAGGGGRVAVDLVEALADRPQALITIDDGNLTGFGLRESLDSLDVPVRTVRNQAELTRWLNTVDGDLVIAHFWNSPAGAPERRPDRPVVLVSHGSNRLPEGYDGYVFLTKAHKAQHPEHPPERCHILPNGVDCRRFLEADPDEIHWSPRPDGRVRIVILSRLAGAKVHAGLLRILKSLEGESVEVVIAGGGERRWWMERSLSEHPIGVEIRFIGPVANNDVPGLLAAADIGLHLTQTHRETHSIAILEMMAAGLPIVGQPRGCLNELIAHGDSGFLYESEIRIAAALRRLIRDAELRATFGQTARQRALTYDLRHFRERWRQFVMDQLNAPADVVSANVTVALPSHGIARIFERTWTSDDPTPPRTLFIAAPARSGGTLLTHTLSMTETYGQAGEFNAWPKLERMAPGELSNWMENTIDTAASLEGRFAWRVMIARMERLDVLMRGDPENQLWLERIAPAAWLRVRRHDRLAQAVSMVRARLTGAFADWGNLPLPPPPEYDADLIAEELARIDSEAARWDALFERHGVTPITLEYETFSADPRATVAAILTGMGLSTSANSMPPPVMKKQADAVSRAWIDRFLRERGKP